MSSKLVTTSLFTIVHKEYIRFMRIWSQTLLPPIINQTLYFIVFGSLIGSQIRDIGGISYMAFIVPGLMMMAIISSSFMNVVSSFYLSKFQRSIEELLVSPTPKWVILTGYVFGGMLRGLMVGLLIFLVSLFFVAPQVDSILVVGLFALLTSFFFSLAGMTMGIYASNFDHISMIPTFVLTPLTYLGGVFYSIKDLPVFWQNVSKLNPILYMIDGFRYGFYSQGDVNVWTSIVILSVLTAVLFVINLQLLKKGVRLKS